LGEAIEKGHLHLCEVVVEDWFECCDVIPISLSPNASRSPSPPRGPITRSMMKKIHMNLSRDYQVNHGILSLFTWAKEIYKI